MFQKNCNSNQQVVEKRIKSLFNPESYGFNLNNHELSVELPDLEESLKRIKEECSFIMLLDICGVDNLDGNHDAGKRFCIVYHLLSMQYHQRIRIKTSVGVDEEVPTVVNIWKSAEWFERETCEMFGIKFSDGKKERLLTHNDFVGYPLRKDYFFDGPQPLERVSELNVSYKSIMPLKNVGSREWVDIKSSNPAINGALRIMAELESELIKNTKLEIGYLHRCFEKIIETKSYNQIIPYADRLNYQSSVMNSVGWCKAVEDLMEIEIPDKAKALRMIFSEFSRVVDHLSCIGGMALNLGTQINYSFCLDQREKIYDLFKRIFGSRVTVPLCRIGGLAVVLPKGWVQDCLNTIKLINKGIDQIQGSLSGSRLWIDLLKVCPVSAKEAIAWGYTGPCLRASGINYDIRKVTPYYFYDQVEFEIPLGVHGECYDRYLVRMEEMRQSIKIISQILDNLPSGAVKIDDIEISLPDKEEVYTTPESLMNHHILITKGISPPPGEIYSSTEVANGELGFYIISDGSSKPYRVKVRPPCYSICQSFPSIVKNHLLSDAIVALDSMNIVAAELDR